jgi:hypothetical protein
MSSHAKYVFNKTDKIISGLPDTNFPVAPEIQDKPEVDLTEWFHAPGKSLYLKYLPYNMTKQDVFAAFKFAGKINRVDIVNSPPNGATYRMAFIHFEYWYSNEYSMDFRSEIVRAYPKSIVRFAAAHELSAISVTINIRPIPKTDYNVEQLSDMFHRLQEQFNTTIGEQSKKIEEQSQQIDELKSQVKHLTNITEETSSDVFYVKKNLDEKCLHCSQLEGMSEFHCYAIDELQISSEKTNKRIDEVISENVKQNEEIAQIKKQWSYTVQKSFQDFLEVYEYIDEKKDKLIDSIFNLENDYNHEDNLLSERIEELTKDMRELSRIDSFIFEKMRIFDDKFHQLQQVFSENTSTKDELDTSTSNTFDESDESD